MQRVDARVVSFQVTPEQSAQGRGQSGQAGVVERRLPFLQVRHEQITHRPADDTVPVDQLGGAELALGGERAASVGRGVRAEHPHRCAATGRTPSPRSRRTVRPSTSADSSRQSPTVMSRRVPPLTARIVAARRSAAIFIVRPAGMPHTTRTSSANPAGSRSRAINGTRFCGARGVSTQPRLGRITSALTMTCAQHTKVARHGHAVAILDPVGKPAPAPPSRRCPSSPRRWPATVPARCHRAARPTSPAPSASCAGAAADRHGCSRCRRSMAASSNRVSTASVGSSVVGQVTAGAGAGRGAAAAACPGRPPSRSQTVPIGRLGRDLAGRRDRPPATTVVVIGTGRTARRACAWSVPGRSLVRISTKPSLDILLAPAMMGEHAGDHVVRHGGEVDLRGGQVGVAKYPLHVGQRHQRIPRHPIRGGVTQVVQGPVRRPTRAAARPNMARAADRSAAAAGGAASARADRPTRRTPRRPASTDIAAATRRRPGTPATAAAHGFPCGPP